MQADGKHTEARDDHFVLLPLSVLGDLWGVRIPSVLPHIKEPRICARRPGPLVPVQR